MQNVGFLMTRFISFFLYELHRVRKPALRISDQVQHKPGAVQPTTEDRQRLEVLELGRRGTVLYIYICSKNKGADQPRG